MKNFFRLGFVFFTILFFSTSVYAYSVQNLDRDFFEYDVVVVEQNYDNDSNDFIRSNPVPVPNGVVMISGAFINQHTARINVMNDSRGPITNIRADVRVYQGLQLRGNFRGRPLGDLGPHGVIMREDFNAGASTVATHADFIVEFTTTAGTRTQATGTLRRASDFFRWAMLGENLLILLLS